MLDPALDDLTRERARHCGVDWRNAWAGRRDDGSAVAWPEAAAARLGLPALEPGPALEITSVLEPLRREPAHASEMISEVRSGEALRGLLQRDRWWLVAGEDGYVGWIHDWVLQDAPPTRPPCDFRYRRPLGTLWISDHHAAAPLLAGEPLWLPEGPVPERRGFRLLRKATGEEGWLPSEELEEPGPLAEPRLLLNFARGLAGVPYRWGGRSPFGFDCSGFVQYLAQRCGVLLPRDATQQAACGDPVDAAGSAAGDLVFFGEPADHVGLLDGRGGIIHCQGRVRAEPLEKRPELAARESGRRRWWGLAGPDGASAWTAGVRGR